MYLDSAYIAKFYLSEPDSGRVRDVLSSQRMRISSIWAMAEVVCAFHRRLREGELTPDQCALLIHDFLAHIEADVWRLIPITERLMGEVAARIATLPAGIFLRAGDAIHLATALDQRCHEIWSNDRHLLAAAPHFGLTGRTA
jgi:predicted nucleic acid-binding protein